MREKDRYESDLYKQSIEIKIKLYNILTTIKYSYIYFGQLEVRAKVEEFRKQKQEEDRQREIEEMFKAEMEKEARRRVAQQEIVRFRERVSVRKTI